MLYKVCWIWCILCNVVNGVNDFFLFCLVWFVVGIDFGDYLVLLDWWYYLGNGIVSVEWCGWYVG